MADFTRNNYRQEVTTEIQKVERITSDAKKYRIDSININISLAVITQYCLINPDSTEEVFAELQEPLISRTIHLNRPTIVLMRSFAGIVGINIRSWMLSSDWIDKVVNEIVTRVKDMVQWEAKPCNFLDVSVQVTARHVYTYNNNEDNQLVETTIPHFVPATESSIQSLEEKKIGCDNCGSCTICFGEYLYGTVALCMPCSHQFHPGCIGHWLRISHYCPVCRFEMPTC